MSKTKCDLHIAVSIFMHFVFRTVFFANRQKTAVWVWYQSSTVGSRTWDQTKSDKQGRCLIMKLMLCTGRHLAEKINGFSSYQNEDWSVRSCVFISLFLKLPIKCISIACISATIRTCRISLHSICLSKLDLYFVLH